EVVIGLLNRDCVEPADDLGDQPVVVLAALLQAEVGDVPGREPQPTRCRRRDRAVLLAWLRGGPAQRPQLRIAGGLVFEAGLAEDRHAAEPMQKTLLINTKSFKSLKRIPNVRCLVRLEC